MDPSGEGEVGPRQRRPDGGGEGNDDPDDDNAPRPAVVEHRPQLPRRGDHGGHYW